MQPIWPVLRFGGGLAIGGAIATAISSVYEPPVDDPGCALVGGIITIILCCGLFRLGMMIRSRAFRMKLAERHILLTVASGVAMIYSLHQRGIVRPRDRAGT